MKLTHLKYRGDDMNGVAADLPARASGAGARAGSCSQPTACSPAGRRALAVPSFEEWLEGLVIRTGPTTAWIGVTRLRRFGAQEGR